MSKPLQWTIGICGVVVTAAIVAALVGPFFLPQTAWGTAGGMMGSGGMMGGWGMMGFGMWLWPVAFIGLIIWGIVALVQSLWRRPATQRAASAADRTCRQCGQPLAADWKACPYCGEKL